MKITLKAARVNAGFTQAKVAETLGFCRTSIVDWEAGTRTPRGDKLLKLCELFGICPTNIELGEK